MTTLTSNELDAVFGGKGPTQSAQPAKPDLQPIIDTAAGFVMCKGVAAVANGPFPKGAPIEQKLDHIRYEQRMDKLCAEKFPL